MASGGWSELPEDILLSAMSAMEVPDVVRSSAVCSSWRSTYATFRRLRLPSPKQSPCLLYPCDASAPDSAALYSPSADATFRMTLPRHLLVLAGSAYGWVFATDEGANPYLLNPLTGAQVVLPPITTFQCQCYVGSSLDDGGNVVYHFDDPRLGDELRIFSVTSQTARSSVYHQVAISAGGSAPSCVVLVVHEDEWDLHVARPGDRRWSLLSSLGTGFTSAVYNDKDGLFYVLQCCGTVHALDLHGHGGTTTPTSRIVMRTHYLVGYRRYLATTPCGDVLMVARRYDLSWERVDRYDSMNAFSVYKLDLGAKKNVKLEAGIGEQYMVFLGDKSSAVVVIMKEEEDSTNPNPRLRPNCVYMADFIRWNIVYPQREAIKRRDMAIYWDFGSRDMHNVADLWPNLHLLDVPETAPAPIWITPSF